MMSKKKSTEAANFSANEKLNLYLNSFHFTESGASVQCLNCDARTSSGQSIPTALIDEPINKMYVFRTCLDCCRSFADVGDDLKKDFSDNLLKKARAAEGQIK